MMNAAIIFFFHIEIGLDKNQFNSRRFDVKIGFQSCNLHAFRSIVFFFFFLLISDTKQFPSNDVSHQLDNERDDSIEYKQTCCKLSSTYLVRMALSFQQMSPKVIIIDALNWTKCMWNIRWKTRTSNTYCVVHNFSLLHKMEKCFHYTHQSQIKFCFFFLALSSSSSSSCWRSDVVMENPIMLLLAANMNDNRSKEK